MSHLSAKWWQIRNGQQMLTKIALAQTRVTKFADKPELKLRFNENFSTLHLSKILLKTVPKMEQKETKWGQSTLTRSMEFSMTIEPWFSRLRMINDDFWHELNWVFLATTSLTLKSHSDPKTKFLESFLFLLE